MIDRPTAAEIAVMLQRCGLSHNDAADYLDADLKVVRRWLDGRYEIGAERWQALVDLCARQDRAVDNAFAKMRETVADYGDPREITVILSRSAEEAEQRGWPCIGAHAAVLRRLVERAPDGITIIPVHAGDDEAADLAARNRNLL